jgi:hypothetical protein
MWEEAELAVAAPRWALPRTRAETPFLLCSACPSHLGGARTPPGEDRRRRSVALKLIWMKPASDNGPLEPTLAIRQDLVPQIAVKEVKLRRRDP